MNEFNTIKKAVERLWAVQNKYIDFGACDTEPRAIIRAIVRKALRGQPVTVPVTGDAWELYSTSMNCSRAAKSLHSATTKLIKLIEKHKNCSVENYLLFLVD